MFKLPFNLRASLLALWLPLLAALALSPCVQAGAAAGQAVAKFLASRESPEEGAKLQASQAADLDGDNDPELVVVWTALGPSHWRNHLTILKRRGAEYRDAGSLQLDGEAELGAVQGGAISVNQKTFAESDPRCCPSIAKTLKYRWKDGRVAEIR